MRLGVLSVLHQEGPVERLFRAPNATSVARFAIRVAELNETLHFDEPHCTRKKEERGRSCNDTG